MNNIFSTKLVNEVSTFDVNFIEAGIHDNVKITEVRVDKSINTKASYIEFTFTDADGKSLKETVWAPEQFPNETIEQFQKRTKNVTTRLMQIFWSFYEKDSIVFEAETWEAGFNWIKEKLDAVKENRLVRIKAVYGNPTKEGKQYVELPRYWSYTFIEPMDVIKSNINKLGIDQFERVKADAETKKTSGFDTFATAQVAQQGIDAMSIEQNVSQPVANTWTVQEGMPF